MKSRVVEILQYRLKTGTGRTFHRIMQDISVPLHVEQGIDVVAYGCSRHDADSYFLLRAFENEEEMHDVLEGFMPARRGVQAREKPSLNVLR